jgi:hypothetical protein
MSLIGQTASETVSRMHATIGRGINLKVTPQQGHPQQITAPNLLPWPRLLRSNAFAARKVL